MALGVRLSLLQEVVLTPPHPMEKGTGAQARNAGRPLEIQMVESPGLLPQRPRPQRAESEPELE